MNLIKRSLLAVTCAALVSAGPLLAKAQPQTLVTVGDLTITADQLQQAVASSPFATQFVTMDEHDQAALRGDLLRRLVSSQLLYLEALDQGLEQTPAFHRELEDQRLGLLYRYYMDKLRDQIRIPELTLAALKQQFKDDPDGLAATKSIYRSETYRTLRLMTIKSLREKRHLKLYEERLRPGIMPDTLLLEGDGVRITYGDIVDTSVRNTLPNPEWVKDQLYKRAELLLIALEAEAEGVDVSDRLERFRRERLPAMMLEQKEREWVPDEQAMRDWFRAHPEVGRLNERRHVGQLVLASREEAEAMRKRILAGESLFQLAGRYSVDPYGKSHNGDMGWIREGRGVPELDQAVSKLADGEISDIVQTPAGFHILTVLERRPGGQRGYAAIRGKIRQLMIGEKLPGYLQQLEKKYQVVWNLVDTPAADPGTSADGGE